MPHPLLSTRGRSPSARVASFRRCLRALAALAALAPATLPAQLTPTLRPTHEQDAAVVAPGVLRLRAPTTWSRWDATVGPSGLRPLGAPFGADGVDTRLPSLVATQGLLRALLSNTALVVSPGRADVRAATRTVVTPVTLEYGVMRRLQLSVALPIVQTRTNVVALLDATAAGTNLGINPAHTNADSLARNSATVTQLANAATQLSTRLAQCRSAPTQAGCAPILADSAAVRQLAETVAQASVAIGVIYGSGTSAAGQLFVPSGDLHAAVRTRLDALSASVQQYLGPSGAIVSRPAGAVGVGGSQELSALVTDPANGLGGSLGSFQRYGTGDIEVAATVQLLDRWTGKAGAALRARVALSALVRLPTGVPPDTTRLYDVGLGDGQMDYEGTVLSDLLLRDRVGLSLAARYTMQPGEVGSGFATLIERTGMIPLGPVPTARRLGDVLQLDVTPRFVIARRLAVNAHYGLLHRADDQFAAVGSPDIADAPNAPGFAAGGMTEHRAGVGFSYTTLGEAGSPRPRLPFDVTFVHLETLDASGGPTPKLRRDQLQVRLYYQLLRRR